MDGSGHQQRASASAQYQSQSIIDPVVKFLLVARLKTKETQIKSSFWKADLWKLNNFKEIKKG